MESKLCIWTERAPGRGGAHFVCWQIPSGETVEHYKITVKYIDQQTIHEEVILPSGDERRAGPYECLIHVHIAER